MQLEVFLQQEQSSKKNCSLWHWQICPSYMWAGCSGWIRHPYMCQSVCDQDTKSQVAPRGREAPWWQLLTRHTVYVHLFYLIFKNIFWHVSAGCLLTILWMPENTHDHVVICISRHVCVLCGSPNTKLIWIGTLREIFCYACCSSLYMDISVVAPPAVVYFGTPPCGIYRMIMQTLHFSPSLSQMNMFDLKQLFVLDHPASF